MQANQPSAIQHEKIIIPNGESNESYNLIDPSTITNGVVKSRRKTSLKEFSISNRLRPEVKAGFKVWLKGNYFHFDDEWKRLFYEYNHRE